MLLYFIPDVHPVAQEAIDAAGLGYALDASRPAFCSCRAMQGPGGQAGSVCAMTPNAARVEFHADRQTWRPLPGKSAWVGFDSDAPPTPEQLAVPRQLAGHFVELADGQPWLVPVARGWSYDADNPEDCGCYVALPQTSELDEAGRWVPGEVVPRLAWLWRLACRFEDRLAGLWQAVGDGDQVGGELAVNPAEDFHELHAQACQVLAVNYRLTAGEIAALGLLTEQSAVDVMLAVIDTPTRRQWAQKKTAAAGAAGASSSAGPAA